MPKLHTIPENSSPRTSSYVSQELKDNLQDYEGHRFETQEAINRFADLHEQISSLEQNASKITFSQKEMIED